MLVQTSLPKPARGALLGERGDMAGDWNYYYYKSSPLVPERHTHTHVVCFVDRGLRAYLGR